ncbi:hypothetical protein F5Y16DRAFT_311363 [Xylariaceae sp. FL0255]|nr:hypothetical protein F5Y16DRAFT_311363 [Xylariaceae sp. FL0255]
MITSAEKQDPLAGIDDIDWSSYEDAYGPATNTPKDLRALASRDEEQVDNGQSTLYGTIYHQGSRYTASPLAVPFLIRIVADPESLKRSRVIYYIILLAVGHFSPTVIDIAGIRKRLEDFRKKTPEEYKAGLQAWVDAAPSEGLKSVREIEVDFMTHGKTLKRLEAELATYDAARKGLPVMLELCHDPNPEIRMAALFFLAWFPEDSEASVAVLKTVLKAENETPTIVATAILGLSFLSKKEDSAIKDGIRPFLSSTESWIEWATAMALISLGESDSAVIDSTVKYLGQEPTSSNEELNFVPFLTDTTVSAYTASYIRMIPNCETLVGSAVIAELAKLEKFQFTEMSAAVLGMLFGEYYRQGEGGKTVLPPFEELTPNQREVVRLCARADGWCWSYANWCPMLGDFGLPGRPDKMREYAGIEKPQWVDQP